MVFNISRGNALEKQAGQAYSQASQQADREFHQHKLDDVLFYLHEYFNRRVLLLEDGVVEQLLKVDGARKQQDREEQSHQSHGNGFTNKVERVADVPQVVVTLEIVKKDVLPLNTLHPEKLLNGHNEIGQFGFCLINEFIVGGHDFVAG